MVKVVIADDEERICQLIVALVDWEGLGLELAGVAHNGLEAIELVKRFRPDILITDIRMPGCSGLELIGQVKGGNADLEIIIISGYAHFEYAQQAIKYGVGDYLLKPVNRAELTATLEKLKGRVCRRRESALDQEKLLEKARKDVHLLQTNLVSALMKQEEPAVTLAGLREVYRLEVRPGIFQAFWMKMDCGRGELGSGSAAVLMDKAKEMLELEIREKCTVLALAVEDDSCAGILNYPDGRQENIRRAMKSYISRLELQKSLFQPVSFSVALGSASRRPEELGASMREASLLIAERYLRGTGRLYEKLGQPSGVGSSGVLERYLREMAHAVEVLSTDALESAIADLESELRGRREVRGYELLDAVISAADVFAVKTQMAQKQQFLEEFRRRCGRCGSADELFACLREAEGEYIRGLSEKQESEAIRPIRRAKQYIKEHYSEPITQEEVSGAVGLSPAYFSMLFKKTEGEGFAKYLIGVRMEEAKILLRETNLPVAEICRRVGYNDLKHFTHTFEKTAGVKPAVYRRLYG